MASLWDGYEFKSVQVVSTLDKTWRTWILSSNRLDLTSKEPEKNIRKQSQDMMIRGFNSLTQLTSKYTAPAKCNELDGLFVFFSTEYGSTVGFDFGRWCQQDMDLEFGKTAELTG